jgi:hypothetical protein
MFRQIVLAVCAFALLSGCASTAMKKFVGASISEAYMSYGKPENIFDLPDGRRAFQYYWGGGSGIFPGQQSTTIAPTGGGAYNVTTTGTPALIYESKGCLVTLIARPVVNGDFVVEEYRIPKRLVC